MVLQRVFIRELRSTVKHDETLRLTCDSGYEPQWTFKLFRVLVTLRSSPTLIYLSLVWLLRGHTNSWIGWFVGLGLEVAPSKRPFIPFLQPFLIHSRLVPFTRFDPPVGASRYGATVSEDRQELGIESHLGHMLHVVITIQRPDCYT